MRPARWADAVRRTSGLVLAGAGLVCLVSCSGSSRANPDLPRSQGATPPIKVGVVAARRVDLIRKITVPGTLAAFKEATLYGKVAGYLSSISVDKGDTVRGGQSLATLEVPEMVKELDQAGAAHQEALANLERSKAQAALQAVTYGRYREVHSRDPEAISAQELDEYRSRFEVAQAETKLAEAKVATARANRDRLAALHRYATITAPFRGVITARFVDPGALIQAATSSTQGQPVVTIQDLDTVRVYVSVPEVDVPFIRAGTPVSLTIAAYPQRVFKASVTRFSEALDPATRTMKTEMDLRNPQHLLRPGMYANVTLELENRPGALVVPAPALVIEGQAKFVYIVRDGKAHRTRVETGFDDGVQVEILSGLTEGAKVIVQGQETLEEGKAVEPSPLGTWMK